MRRSVAHWSIVALAMAAAAGPGLGQPDRASGNEVRTAPARHPGGIWKAVVPPTHMKAEFGGHDPVGLAAGARIKADCSLNWINPDTGKLYCFATPTSLNHFLDWPQRNIARAAEAWHTQ